MNIRINYLYRDGGNYKAYDTKIFTNKGNCTIEEIEATLKLYLIDGVYFYANKWGFKNLYPQTPTIEDPTWHELMSVEETNEKGEEEVGNLFQIIKL